jgi:hypothetical protein
MSEQSGKFDLNMEEVLEAWGVPDATREIIANALDEQALTETDEVEIYEDEQGRWHIRDYGRGLKHEHLTQSEDEEKLNSPDKVIGKFGVGLKDALATFHRNDVDVTIHSEHETITIEKAPKENFENIETLHGIIRPPQKDIQGTDVVLDGVSRGEIEEAKNNFLRFTDDELLEETRFGEVYASPEEEDSRIYVTGLKVAMEEKFLFSYNITNTTKTVRDALNRERSNVGRTAYSSRVKDVLQDCESKDVAQPLVDDFQSFASGTTHDEVGWKPIRLHAVKLLNQQENVVFATVDEQQEKRDLLDHAEREGRKVVTVPENIREEIEGERDETGEQIRSLDVYREEYNESFEYEWVEEEEMSEEELQVWELRHDILDLLHREPPVNEIRVSETIRMTEMGEMADGVWQREENRIVIRRNQLENPQEFAGTLLHEVAHPRSGGASDLTKRFEKALTRILGEVGVSAVQKNDSR